MSGRQKLSGKRYHIPPIVEGNLESLVKNLPPAIKSVTKPELNWSKPVRLSETGPRPPVTEPYERIAYDGVTYAYMFTGKTPTDIDSSKGLRAVILDNDETTGYYVPSIKPDKPYPSTYSEAIVAIAEDLYPGYSHYREISNMERQIVPGKTKMRPGIMDFLKKLKQLKDEGRIDVVIMYTNMSGNNKFILDGEKYTRPEVLSGVFTHLAGGPIFDLLIFREGSSFGTSQKYI